MIIFLIGYRCTGKTSAGKALARLLNRSFIDADAYLVNRYGISISEMVTSQGWESFRKKESIVLKTLCEHKHHVIATGGGVILDHSNVAMMKKNSVIVWLRARPETIKKRIIKDDNTKDSRPSLTSKGLLEEIEETLLFRNPLYEDAMDFYVDTDGIEIDDICKTIITNMRRLDHQNGV